MPRRNSRVRRPRRSRPTDEERPLTYDQMAARLVGLGLVSPRVLDHSRHRHRPETEQPNAASAA